MISLRVRHRHATVAQPAAAGVTVEVDPGTYPNGHSATAADPEGNLIRLWEPDAAASRPPGQQRRTFGGDRTGPSGMTPHREGDDPWRR
jgi:hypothetical protein